jgi:cytochrome c peroxidase
MKTLLESLIVIIAAVVAASSNAIGSDNLTAIEALGKKVYFDRNLSLNSNQSCVTCHAPEAGFSGPDSDINSGKAVYPGAIPTRFSNRKPPTAAYGGDSPVLKYDEDEEIWIGGMFWDGRASGWVLGDPLAEQAQVPFLNPLEHALPDAKTLCVKVARSDYAQDFKAEWGDINCAGKDDVMEIYGKIARSLAAYQRSSEVNAFSSKFDAFWEEQGKDVSNFGVDTNGKYRFNPSEFSSEVYSAKEAKGLALFNAENKGKCALCHLTSNDGKSARPLFTDFTYDNLGIPKNPDNPFYGMLKKWNPDGADWIDFGLGSFLESKGLPYEHQLGKQKVPTLRNVDKRPSKNFIKAYAHNGFFKTLENIVRFYNTRDIGKWPAPEYPKNVNTEELGNLGLTPEEEVAIVAFMKTLSDGFSP